MSISIISSVSCHSFSGIANTLGQSIFQSSLVGFQTSSKNSAAAVLSFANPRHTVVVRICMLTICYICTNMFDVLVAATVNILWIRRAVRVSRFVLVKLVSDGV